jgi:epsilon-lactone hydrolase
MPSMRAKVMRRVLVTGVETMRRASGGAPDPLGPAEDLEEYALRLREQMERMGERMTPGRRVSWHTVESMGTVGGEWVEDLNVAADDRVMLHLHGGAYVMGSPRTHRGLASWLSRTSKSAVVLPEYRLAPEHVFPAALEDAMGTYRWLLEERGFRPERIAISGDSSGGGLGLALLVRLRDEGRPLPACYVGMSPWTDLAGTGGSMSELDELDPWLSAAMVEPAARAYAGETALDDPWLSPLYADMKGLPPMLVHVGEHEILRDDARRVVERAREAGVEASLGVFEEMWHVFHAFPGLPETRVALREIGAFVRRCTVPPKRLIA